MTRPKPLPLLLLIALFGSWAAGVLAQQHGSHGPAPHATTSLGRVDVPVSCSAAARRAFNEGMLYQHSFWHAAAVEHFRAALASDPGCGMARWGMALATLDNLFQTPGTETIAQAASLLQGATARNARDTAWIAALGPLLQPADTPWAQRLPQFLTAMERIAEASPRDNEAQIFLGLALVMAAPADDPEARMLRRAASILDRAWKREPRHPGAIHYLIHAHDTPPLAAQGMEAARRYAEVVPDSTHAVHMPSHIFTRLGAWDRSITSNQRAARLAIQAGLVNDALHAQDYLVYAMLQSGRTAAAAQVWAGAVPTVPRLDPAHQGGPFAAAAMPARLALEPGDWAAAAALPVTSSRYPEADALTRFARAIGLARSNRAGEVAEEVAALGTLAAALRAKGEAYWAGQVAIQQAAAAALAQIASGAVEPGLAALRAAADAEDATQKSAVTPGPLAPVRELLGEALLALGRAAEAEREFVRVMAAEPGRFRALYGAAAAAEAAGMSEARARFQHLLDLARSADTARPELDHARRASAPHGR